jgi:hypothetical protein
MRANDVRTSSEYPMAGFGLSGVGTLVFVPRQSVIILYRIIRLLHFLLRIAINVVQKNNIDRLPIMQTSAHHK